MAFSRGLRIPLGVDNKSGKIRTETYTGVLVRGLRIPPRFSPCKTHSREMAQTSGFDPTTQVKTCFDCKMFDVSYWVASLNGENGPGGTPSHEALSVSPQGALEISSVAGQPPSLDRSHCSPPRLVAKSLQCDDRCRPSSQRPQYPTLYRRLKRRLGRSLRPKFYQGSVVRSGKKASHKCPRIEGGLPGPSRLQGPVPESNSVGCDGQLNSGSLHQQTRRNTLGRDVCSPVEDHDLVPSLSHNIESQAHSRVPECDGRPAIQVQPSAVNRMVSAPTGLQTDLPEVVHTSCRLICHSPEPQTPSIRVSYPRPKGLGHRCSEHKLDQPHSICVPSYGSPSQGDPKDQAMPVPDHRNSPRLARDALVLGPSAALNRDPTATPSVNNPTQTVPQAGVPQQPPAPEPPRLVSRSGQLQEQGFSMEVAERVAAPQRSSTRTIYKSKWALFEKWCRENSVDFSTPSVKQISDFFMYLYQDLNRRPSTIDGYRTAIVDTLGPTAQHIAHNADLQWLLSSFHRDRPKSSRNLPKWNLSVVLNELTKAPFEPMKDTDLKHLTLKTAFLLALASGKRRSEIHAWVANKVSNLGQWEKVALFPSSDFIAKNQLAREGSQSVSPVTIPALTTIVDRQFKEDRTLCPVRALRFYLDRTKDLRGSRSLLFISFKKGHTSDIRPATLSSWLKQTILLCYKQGDQQALDLVQVKAHDIRAFAASKAFYGGVSVDQIMQACHWKAHNTFTNFDTLGPTAQHIAHNADLQWLLSSFHRDRPKSSRNLPKWNLSVVLNELTKAPFEPMKDTDLKHLTLKTAFLLALASGKRRSEIHAWVANKVSNLGQWEKVALFPSSDFIAKNQLAREGSQSVSPVTIPALTTIVDRQFKEDRTLCPVRALRFYLDRTKDLRGSRSLLFISFKKGHTSDIRPATLSSWLKQTILLCYKQADQQALDLVQVKAHDIRAFAASKAFYGGVSVDQIMQACHWKAHNTFTNFYLKDLTWSDTDNNLYLGPVVAAQQVLDPSPQTSCPRKEKRGGGGTSATTKSSGVFPRI